MRSATKVLFALVILAGASSARAQATRTWVSGVGDDANPCSRTAPCKTWAGAISKTATAGEIDALDPGGFGAVTITKSITLDGSGTLGSILAANVSGIVVNGANAVVLIRGLSINGINTGISGVKVINALSVTVDKCNISNFTVAGIDDERTAAGLLFVKNNNINNAAAGIIVGGAAVISATVTKTTVFNGGIGLHALGTAASTVNISDSVFAGNGAQGLLIEAAPILNMNQGAIVANAIGVQAGGTARFSSVLFSNNGTGVTGTGSFTFGNNPLAGNAADGTFSNTVAPQ